MPAPVVSTATPPKGSTTVRAPQIERTLPCTGTTVGHGSLERSVSGGGSYDGSAPTQRPQPASPFKDRDGYFDLENLMKSLPSTPAAESSKSPRASLPFPSRRPNPSRPDSTGSPRTRRGSLGPTPPTSPGSFPSPRGTAALRGTGDGRRMAAFLDKTAAAMEGGKSLAMVLPLRGDTQYADLDAEAELTFLEALAYEEDHAPPAPGDPVGTQAVPSDSARTNLGTEPSAPVESSMPRAGSTSKTRTSPMLGSTRLLEKRTRVVQELVDTEQSHAMDMAVVRDIYLARARGAHLTQIADHVMATGLGLHRESGPRQRRSTVPTYRLGQPLMSDADLETVFINLDEVAALAETFAAALAKAADPAASDDIGRVFLDVLPRVQEVSSRYCVRHHRAILRLQELEPALKTYLSECATLSHGRTTAWDLASLLIKPVQRCLKYPLLLDQLLAATPDDHPDRPQLQQAYAEMLVVAENINENKKRTDLVSRIVAKDKPTHRRDTSRSVSDSLSKKLRRTSQRTRNIFDTVPAQDGNETFDALVPLVHTTRAGAQRFCLEMREWAESTRSALEAQVRLVEGWIDMYAPLIGETPAAASHERLCVFLDEVLLPVIAGPWAVLDEEIRSSLSVKGQHLLSLFDNPLQVISKRSDKALDHARYLAKKQPVDKRGSEEFLLLSAQLSEEVPRFLGSVSRYFNIIVSHFASAQAAYHEAVRKRWDAYADRWLTQIPRGSPRTVQAAFEAEHQPIVLMMRTLATGLGVHLDYSPTISRRTSSPCAAARPPSREPPRSVTPHDALRRESHLSTASERTADSDRATSAISTPRTSVTSTSSRRPSGRDEAFRICAASSAEGYHTDAAWQVNEPHETSPTPKPALPAPPSSERSVAGARTNSSDFDDVNRMSDFASHLRPQRAGARQDAASLRSRYLSQYSVVLPSESGSEGSDDSVVPLYVAEAVSASRSSSFRSGFPILSFDAGDRFEVEYEEADRAEGGSGWLLGRKPYDRGNVGWARTEDFVLLEDVEEEDEAEVGTAGLRLDPSLTG